MRMGLKNCSSEQPVLGGADYNSFSFSDRAIADFSQMASFVGQLGGGIRWKAIMFMPPV